MARHNYGYNQKLVCLSFVKVWLQTKHAGKLVSNMSIFFCSTKSRKHENSAKVLSPHSMRMAKYCVLFIKLIVNKTDSTWQEWENKSEISNYNRRQKIVPSLQNRVEPKVLAILWKCVFIIMRGFAKAWTKELLQFVNHAIALSLITKCSLCVTILTGPSLVTICMQSCDQTIEDQDYILTQKLNI
jgi:hypothetical protein